MFELSVKNNRGEELNLTNNEKYTVFKVEGLNPPQATINSAVNVTTDGSTVNSTKVENRNIVIYMTINGDVEANRINLYKYFPVKKEITLYFSHETRDVYIKGYVELLECDLFAQRQTAQVSIICPQPYFSAVDYFVTTFSDISSLFTFPFSIASGGIELSAITTNIRKTILNTGDTESGIIIELYARGDVVNPIIYDVDGRVHFKLNFTLRSGDTVVINTNVGEKSVTLIRNGISTNAMGYMTPDSSWFTLGAGDNIFTYDADSGNSNLQITFRTKVLYSGV